MKQKIEFEIEIPDGKKAVWKDRIIVFEDIKPQLPTTWEEFCYNIDRKPNEAYIANSSEIQRISKNHNRHSYQDRNILPSIEAAEQHLTLMQLHQLRDCYRQGWKPNYEEDSQKWFISRFENILEINCSIRRNAFLTFPTKELAEQFLTNFKDLIEQAGDLI